MKTIRAVLLLATFLGIVFFASALLSGERLVLKTKPLTLEPYTHSIEHGDNVVHHGVMVSSLPVTLSRDTWVTGIQVGMENAPHATLHHISVYVEGEPNPDCPADDQKIIGLGAETATDIRFPAPYGVFLPKGARIYLDGMLHNPLPPLGPGGTYEDVQATVTLLREKSSDEFRPLTYRRLALVDAPDCVKYRSDSTFVVPAHTERFERASHMNVPEPNEERAIFKTAGRIISIGGHLHPWEGGKQVEVFHNKERIATFTSQKTGQNMWDWYTPGITNLSLPVFPGDEITLSAVYENMGDEPLTGAMGVIGFYVAEEP